MRGVCKGGAARKLCPAHPLACADGVRCLRPVEWRGGAAGTESLKPPSPPPFARHTINRTTKNIPEFKVQPEMALELLMAANFLDA